MRLGLSFIAAVAAAIVLLTAGCGSGGGITATTPSPDANHHYIPVSENAAVYSTERMGSPDDVVLWPGGAEYRGNTESDLPPVPLATARSGDIAVTWRENISSKPGEIKYNIVKVHADAAVTSAYLYMDDAPSWLALAARPAYVDSADAWGPVLIMTIAPNTPPGEYRVDLGLLVNGTDYGTVPIKLTIIAPF